MTAAWKTEQLPSLEGFGLFPFGGGPKGKAPIGGDDWQTKPETVAQISARNGTCKAVAIYPSQQAGFECFDVDGKTAYDYLRNVLKVDPDAAVAAGAWKIYRQSDPYRFKLIFRVPNPAAVAEGKANIVTLTREDAADGETEQLEWFYGKQGALVAGLHKLSRDYYLWENGPQGNGIANLLETPLEWQGVRAAIRCHAPQKKSKLNTSELWQDARSIFGGTCPACGRDSGDDCRATIDGKALQCHHGGRFSPDLKLPIGHRLQAGDRVLVLRGHNSENAIGKCSLFTAERAEDLFAAEDSEIKREQIEQFRQSLNSEIALDDVFNLRLATLLTNRAASLPCDPIAYIMPLLATAASVVGKRVRFVIKGGEDTWSEPCVIWGGNIMPPSSLKSPIASDIRKPVERLQKESIERCKGEDEDGEQLKPRRYVFTGITHAAMIDLICEEKTIGLVGHYDELALLFSELEKSHNTAMRAELLSLWTGGAVSRDTKTSGHLYTLHSAVSLFGNIQPDALRKLIAKDGDTSSAGDGLWCRFLWCRPKEMIWQFNEIVANIQEPLSEIIAALDRTPSSTLLKLSPEAVAIGAKQWNAWEYDKQDSDPAEAAFIGKLRGYSVRLAGVLHLLDLATTQSDPFLGALEMGDRAIPAEAMERALLLCRFCLGQWRQLQSELGHGSVPVTVAKLLSKATNMPAVTPRDIVRWHLLGRDAKTADAAAFLREVVETWGCGTLQQTQKGSVAWLPPA
jgi:hypothetical protein